MNTDIFNIIDNRRSCRNYLDKEIPEDVLNDILDAACKSPSGGGFQLYSIIKVTDNSKREKLVDLCFGQKFIKKAPVSLIFCIDYNRLVRINELEPSPCNLTNNFMNFWMGLIDTSISAQTLCLAAEAHGLSSIYIGNLINTIEETSELFNLPNHVLPAIMVTLGYAKSKGKLSSKYGRDVIVHDNEYKQLNDDKLLEAFHNKNSYWNMKPRDVFIEKIYETAENLKDKEFADRCKENIINRGSINPYQYWFGCYYLENDDFMTYNDYVQFMDKKGFNWMKG